MACRVVFIFVLSRYILISAQRLFTSTKEPSETSFCPFSSFLRTISVKQPFKKHCPVDHKNIKGQNMKRIVQTGFILRPNTRHFCQQILLNTGEINGEKAFIYDFQSASQKLSACVPSTWDTLPSNRFILFIVFQLPIQLSPFINYVPPSAQDFDKRSFILVSKFEYCSLWKCRKWQRMEMRNCIIDEILLLSVHPLPRP